jgi:hypothetical protein
MRTRGLDAGRLSLSCLLGQLRGDLGDGNAACVLGFLRQPARGVAFFGQFVDLPLQVRIRRSPAAAAGALQLLDRWLFLVDRRLPVLHAPAPTGSRFIADERIVAAGDLILVLGCGGSRSA